MSRLFVFCLFILVLLSQAGCAYRDQPAYSYQPAPYRDYTIKNIVHQPRNDGYVTVTPLR
ncbi:MAG: hypothetical protein ACI8W8_003212 [Rhodothermales bacterium]|jgi:hypothetical protein